MFGGLLGRASFLGDDLEAWCLETWAWFMRNLGGIDHLRSTPLATPSRDFFPPSDAVGHQRAVHIFGCVKTAMGMDDWDYVLEPYDRREANAQVGEFWFLRSKGAPNGTFRIEDGAVRISYARDLVGKPADLVATLAHELCHYRLATIEEPSPGGPETHELDTDLAVAYAGLGIFGANRAFDFQQHGDAFSQGWRSQRNGYLSERTWAFALSLFLALKDESGAANRWLKPSVAAEVAKADRYLKRRVDLTAPLRAITQPQPNS
jgi:hypothetical protein